VAIRLPDVLVGFLEEIGDQLPVFVGDFVYNLAFPSGYVIL